MRFLNVLLLWLLFAPAAGAQTKPVLERRGEFEFGDQQERVVVHKLLGGENRLLLLGDKTVRVLDVAGAKFVDSRPLGVPESREDKPRLVSPDGRRMLVFGNYESAGKKEKVRPAAVWDLQTGRQVAVLDKTSRPVRTAFWSRNGRTLVTSSDRYAAYGLDDTSVEVAFWDGETFAYRSTLPSDKISWSRVSDDGEKCFFTAGVGRNLWILDKYVASTGAPVMVWDIGGGKLEQTIPPRDGGPDRKVRDKTFSADERYLALILQPPKSNDSERSLSVWEIGRANGARYDIRPRYEVKPSPKISDNGAAFSPDGAYFTLHVGKNLQLYETATGEKKSEFRKDGIPKHWLAGNTVLLFDFGGKLEGLEAATGRLLYQHKLIYEWTSYTNDFGTEVNEPVDTTTIVPHPAGNLFLTYSKQYVKLFDARTGELLQTVISPPTDYTKKKPRLSDKPLVSAAGWSGDGKSLYLISADARSVSLWTLLGG